MTFEMILSAAGVNTLISSRLWGVRDLPDNNYAG